MLVGALGVLRRTAPLAHPHEAVNELVPAEGADVSRSLHVELNLGHGAILPANSRISASAPPQGPGAACCIGHRLVEPVSVARPVVLGLRRDRTSWVWERLNS